MKLLLLSTSFFLLATFVSAQITEAKIVYEMKMASDNPELEMQLSMMQGSKLELVFADNKSRQNVSMGGFMSTTTISDAQTGETLTLMDGMMGKIAMKMNVNDVNEEEEMEEESIEFEFTDETKEILGYTCYKAVSVDEEGNESTFWYSKEIQAPKTESQYIQKQLPGMPLEFQIISPEVTMTFSATEFASKLKKADKNFSMDIPEGYSEMTPEEMQGAFGQ